jgi:integrase
VDDNPCLKVRWRKVDIKERKLVTTVELDRLCEAALKTSKNGQQFGDYLRLLQYSGSRMAETLRLRWADVNWDQKQLVIGAGGESKNKWYQ